MRTSFVATMSPTFGRKNHSSSCASSTTKTKTKTSSFCASKHCSLCYTEEDNNKKESIDSSSLSSRRQRMRGQTPPRFARQRSSSRFASSSRFEKWSAISIGKGRTIRKNASEKRIPDGRTVFGIVSRAIRPRRRGCHRDYLRVCRQRRVEFGASSLKALLLVLVFVVARFVCVGESLVSRVLHLSFLSLVSSLVGN